MRFTKARILGLYLILAALFETGAYCARGVSVLLRPRAGWTALLVTQRMDGDIATALPELLSAFWLLALGSMLVRSKRPMKTYIASEVLFAFPTLLFAVGLVVSGGGHVFFAADGLKMLLLSLAFTFVPILLAVLALKETRLSNTCD